MILLYLGSFGHVLPETGATPEECAADMPCALQARSVRPKSEVSLRLNRRQPRKATQLRAQRSQSEVGDDFFARANFVLFASCSR